MPISKSSSQSSSTLQIPSKSSSRTLRPPSPARSQPGFVVPPKDSQTSLSITISSSANSEEDQPGPLSLAHRLPSPRPVKKVTTKKRLSVTAQTKVKPTDKGKVCCYLFPFLMYSKIWLLTNNDLSCPASIINQQTC